MKKYQKILISISLIIALVCIAFFIMSWTSSAPENLGINNGRLIPCPEKPNCVSSHSKKTQHQIAAISYKGKTSEAMAKVKTIIKNMPRTRIVKEAENYLLVETTTKIFRFVDDNEFYFDEKESVIHIRAASRAGHSDLGLNRKRMEYIRQQFTTQNQ